MIKFRLVTHELESSDADRPESEIEIQLGMPGLASVTWRRRWRDRSKEMIDTALARAGATEVALGKRVSESESFGDLFWKAAERSSQTSDSEYSDALGRLVGAAMDDANIDEAAYVLAELVRLEPIQLRALTRCAVSAVRFDADGLGRECVLEDANSLEAATFRYKQVEEVLACPSWIAESIVERLIAAGLVARRSDTLPPTYDSMSRARRSPSESMFQPTPMALSCIRLLFPNAAARTHYLSPNGPMPPGGRPVD